MLDTSNTQKDIDVQQTKSTDLSSCISKKWRSSNDRGESRMERIETVSSLLTHTLRPVLFNIGYEEIES